MTATRKYSGSLSEPIKWDGPTGEVRGSHGPGLFPPPNAEDIERHRRELEKAEESLFAQRAEKLKLLCADYQIKQSNKNWPILLAYELALEHVPGFKVDFETDFARKLRRKTKWNSSTYARLIINVEEVKREGVGIGDSRAINLLVKRGKEGRHGYETYKPPTTHSVDRAANSLATRLNEARAHVFPLWGSIGSPRKNPDYAKFIDAIRWYTLPIKKNSTE